MPRITRPEEMSSSFHHLGVFLILVQGSLAWTTSHLRSLTIPQPSDSSFYSQLQPHRRDVLEIGTIATLTALGLPWKALAEETEEVAKEDGILSASAIADRLHVVPTFTIVDTKGVPFMVVGEDAKVTSYFFTNYDEADRLLKLAKTSTDNEIKRQKREGVPEEQRQLLENPWDQARISTVPLDFAVTLVTKSMTSGQRRAGGNYFQVSPTEEDVEDALSLTGGKDLAEGKVPVFYSNDFTSKTDTGGTETPLYFSKAQLLRDYDKSAAKANSKKQQPEILVTELFALLTQLVKPVGSDALNADEDLKNLIFVPPSNSQQKAQLCQRKGGKEPPFVLGQRNLIL